MRESFTDIAPRLQVDAVWRQFDTVMMNRALVRLGAAVAWTWLAAAYGEAYVWVPGLLLCVATALSVLHASRPTLDRLFNATDGVGLGRGVRAFFPLPSEPHVADGPGITETVTILLVGASTGWVAPHLWSPPPFAEPGVQVAATLAVVIWVASFAANLVAHPSYAMRPTLRTFYVLTHYLLGPLIGLIAGVVLWPGDGTGIEKTVVVLCSLALVLGTVRMAVQLDKLGSALRGSSENAFASALDLVAVRLHSTLKGPARGLVAALDNSEADGAVSGRSAVMARQLARGLAVRVSQFNEELDPSAAGGSGADAPGVVERILEGTVRLFPRIPAWASGAVTADLSVDALSPIDRDLIGFIVGDLTTNAIAAEATEVQIRLDRDDEASRIRLAFDCTCAHRPPVGRPSAGSLGLLAERLEMVDGRLEVREVDGSTHRFSCEWRPAPGTI